MKIINIIDDRKMFNAKGLDGNGDTKWIMPDRLHPNAAGYTIWTDVVLPHFKAICGK